MKIKYTPTGINNFHNCQPLQLVITGEKSEGHSGPVYLVSAGQAAKIRDHFCGISDCCCSHGACEQLDWNGTKFGIRVAYCS